MCGKMRRWVTWLIVTVRLQTRPETGVVTRLFAAVALADRFTADCTPLP